MTTEIINKAGTISALQLASNGVGLPKGLRFHPDDGSDNNADGSDNGMGDAGNEGGDNGAGDEGDDGGDEVMVPKRHHDGAVAELAKVRRELKESSKALENFKKQMPSMEEFEELREHKTKQAELEAERKKKEGQFETLLKDQQAKHTNEKSELQAALEAKQAELDQERIGNIFASVVPLHTSVPTSSVQRLMGGLIKYDEDRELRCFKENGEPALNPDGSDMTPAQFIEDYIGKTDWLARAQPKGGAGGGNNRARGKDGKARKFTAADLENMSHEEFKKYEKEIMAQTAEEG